MTTRIHSMPYGAEIQADGSVRFRLWAPVGKQIELCLGDTDEDRYYAMTPLGDGWLELQTEDAAPGNLYRYRIDGGLAVPDPASRFQPNDVHGPSEVIDPGAYRWSDRDWTGRPWEESVIYELHVGTFSPQGSFRGVAERLDYLADLGVTAVELMPVADFPGAHNWGYDGVLPFAPDATYGRPEDLKSLVDAAHARGLMVLLDVVYNHFGPEGNYLHSYAPQFFTDRHQTPWGDGINFDGEQSRPVRDFFIHNALYWLEEYHLDGLRLDAVHAIADDSEPHILYELAAAVHDGPGEDRHIHLVLENEENQARFLARGNDREVSWYTAQWNDDIHHAAHVLATGERDGYYLDYGERPATQLARCLAEGFAYQGDVSAFRGGALRGERSAQLPPTAFVDLLQNHDQIGNRALGERINALAEPQAVWALTAILLLAPSPPLLFMGQELMAESPFLFFCDFGAELAQAVTDGRRREFARFTRFADPEAQQTIPDPNDPETFQRSKLDWTTLNESDHADWHRFHQELLALRAREIAPRLSGIAGGTSSFEVFGEGASECCIRVRWELGDGGTLTLTANVGDREKKLAESGAGVHGTLLLSEPAGAAEELATGRLPPWTVVWHLAAREA